MKRREREMKWRRKAKAMGGDGEGMMTDDEGLRVCANKRTSETHVERRKQGSMTRHC